MDDSDDKVVRLDDVRKLRDFDSDTSVCYLEVLWGEHTFAVNAAIRDLEAMRRGTEDAAKPLRDPETVFEAETIIDQMRWLANYLAQSWGLDHMVRPGDWKGDVRVREDD